MSWVSELRRRNLKVMALHSLADEEAAEETLDHLMGEADASAMDLAIVYAFRGQTDRASISWKRSTGKMATANSITSRANHCSRISNANHVGQNS